MKRNKLIISRTTLSAAVLAMLTVGFVGTAQATIQLSNPLASFDYQPAGNDIQAGFAMVPHNAGKIGVQNNIEAQSGGFNSFGQRGKGGSLSGHPEADLLYDWHLDNDQIYEAFIEIRAPNNIPVQDAVLQPGTFYLVRLFHYDNDSFSNTRTGFRVYDEDRTDESKFLVEIGDHGPATDPNTGSFTDIIVQAKPLGPSGTGRIQLEFGAHSNPDRYFYAVNGFQIAIPEPGTFGLLAMGGAFLGFLRRRAK
jgi:hypothetical protein